MSFKSFKGFFFCQGGRFCHPPFTAPAPALVAMIIINFFVLHIPPTIYLQTTSKIIIYSINPEMEFYVLNSLLAVIQRMNCICSDIYILENTREGRKSTICAAQELFINYDAYGNSHLYLGKITEESLSTPVGILMT
jgi:hypothetical protein